MPLLSEISETLSPLRFVEIGRSQSKAWRYVAYVFAGLGVAIVAALVLGGSGSTDSGVRGT